MAFSPGLIRRLSTVQDFDVRAPVFPAERQFLSTSVWDLPIGHGDRFNKKVRHVFLGTTPISSNGALALKPHDLGRQVDAIGRSHEEQDGATGPIRVDHQLDLFARLVLGLVRHEFDVVEAVVGTFELRAADGEDVAAFDGVLFLVRELVGKPVLARAAAFSCNSAVPWALVERGLVKTGISTGLPSS